MSKLPSYLLPVLQLKVQGYPHQTIADELKYPVQTVHKYVQRIIQFFKDEGMWDSRFSSRTGLSVCGRQYLETHVTAPPPSEHDITTIYPTRLLKSMTDDEGQQKLIWAGLSPEQIKEVLRKVASEPFEIGSRAILLANRFYRDWLCTEAIPVFQMAENLLGAATNLAAKAACSTAQMYIELGDMHNAKDKITAAQSMYEAIADPEIKIEMQHINGWIDYNQGNLHQAEAWYRESLQLAEQIGAEHLGKHAHHFLGCIYRDWGSMSACKQKAAEWYHQAEVHLDTAYRIHLTWGEDGDKGYDLFRKAQLRQFQKRSREAQELRDRARDLFGPDLYNLSVDLEEAQIALKNHEEREAQHKAEELLESWKDLKRTRGISDSLRLIGDVKRLKGNVHHAFELYVASLCLYPYPNCPNNRKLWQSISDILHQAEGKTKEKQVKHILEQLDERKGPFVYLNSVTVDRSADIAQIVNKLVAMAK